jgi:hypothetical protein
MRNRMCRAGEGDSLACDRAMTASSAKRDVWAALTPHHPTARRWIDRSLNGASTS